MRELGCLNHAGELRTLIEFCLGWRPLMTTRPAGGYLLAFVLVDDEFAFDPRRALVLRQAWSGWFSDFGHRRASAARRWFSSLAIALALSTARSRMPHNVPIVDQNRNQATLPTSS
jgi:hypothetical protein